jgi:hypothetical protein
LCARHDGISTLIKWTSPRILEPRPDTVQKVREKSRRCSSNFVQAAPPDRAAPGGLAGYPDLAVLPHSSFSYLFSGSAAYPGSLR